MDYCAFSDKSRRTVCSCDEYLTVLCKIDGYRVFINEDIFITENKLILVDIR